MGVHEMPCFFNMLGLEEPEAFSDPFCAIPFPKIVIYVISHNCTYGGKPDEITHIYIATCRDSAKEKDDR